MGACVDCGLEKELTQHGTCWKCHLKGVRFNSRIEARACKNCGGEQYRTSQKITTNITSIPLE